MDRARIAALLCTLSATVAQTGCMDSSAAKPAPIPAVRGSLPSIYGVDQLLGQCGSKDEKQDVEAYVQNFNGKVNWPDPAFVKRLSRSTGLLTWRNFEAEAANAGVDPGNVIAEQAQDAWCSGSLIGKAHFLTAGHCLEIDFDGWTTPSHKASERKLTAWEFAPYMQVRFNFQHPAGATDDGGAGAAAATFRVEALEETGIYMPNSGQQRPDGERLDYAILRLSKTGVNAQGETVSLAKAPGTAPTPLDAQKTTLTAAQKLMIAQHPGGIPKVVDTGGRCKFSSGCSTSVVEGDGEKDAETFILYANIDTQEGSSGAGITNDAGRLIGIHVAGGCVAADNRAGANVGISLFRVATMSPIIRGLR